MWLNKNKIIKNNWFGAQTQINWVQVWNNLNGGNCWRKVKKHDKNQIFIYGKLILKQNCKGQKHRNQVPHLGREMTKICLFVWVEPLYPSHDDTLIIMFLSTTFYLINAISLDFQQF